MAIYLGILIFSFTVTGILMIPFINLLFRLHLTHHGPIKALTRQESREFAAIQSKGKWKIGTPIGGGLLLIFTTTLLYTLLFPVLGRSGIYITAVFPFKEELNIIFFTFLSFGLLGLYDDLIKIFRLPQARYASRIWPQRKTFFILLLAFLIALTLYFNLHLQLFYIPFLGPVNLGWVYIPLATVVITAFCKSYDITDGMDGLAGGVLFICLLAFWGISLSSLDTVLSVFIALWTGGLLAFLYFNVYPARIWLGNAGSLSFGATLAVAGLVLNKTFALFIIGSIFIIEGLSQLLQKIFLKLSGKKFLPVTPVHYWLQSLGWEEPKIVLRLWLLAILSAVIGLWFATF